MAGGEIATKQDQKTGQVKSITSVYEVTIPIDNHELLLQPGLRGFAKIDGGTPPSAGGCGGSSPRRSTSRSDPAAPDTLNEEKAG